LLDYLSSIIYLSFVSPCNAKHPDIAVERENQREENGEYPCGFGNGLPEGVVDRVESTQQKTCNPRRSEQLQNALFWEETVITKTQDHADIPLGSHQTQVEDVVVQKHMRKVKDNIHFPLKKRTTIYQDVKTDST